MRGERKNLKQILKEVAEKLDLPQKRVNSIYYGFIDFIKTNLEAIDYNIPPDEGTNKDIMRRVNLIYLGKIVYKLDNGKENGPKTMQEARRITEENRLRKYSKENKT